MDNLKDEEVKDSILTAAKRVFQKWGLNKTTMEDIAREAGKAKSTLYYYFKSKDEIFDISVSQEINKILAKAKESTLGMSSPMQRLKQYIISSLTEIKEHAALYNIIRGELQVNYRFIEKLRIQIQPIEHDFIKELLQAGLELNEFKHHTAADPDKLALTISGIISGMELLLFFGNDDMQQVNLAAELITNGI